jgi:putative ABC transport system permease protein
MLSRILRRLWQTLHPGAFRQDLAEELRTHLQREAERHLATGLSPADANRKARREFGNLAMLEESAADAGRLHALDELLRAARLAARTLLRRPGFTITAALSLGLGIAAATTVFSVVDALVLRPLPYRNPASLVSIWPTQILANQEVARLREQATSYSAVASFSPGWLMSLTGVPVPRQLDAAKVSGNFFSLLGTPPLLGHTFDMQAEARGNDRVAVLSEDLWSTTFDRDPAIVGRSIMLGGTPFTVSGVMPRSFRLLDNQADLWLPMAMDPLEWAWKGGTTLALGSLRQGATQASATSELRVLATQMEHDFQHDVTWRRGATVTTLQEALVGPATGVLTIVMLAVTFLLLIAIVNVVNLLLVRTAEREQELAIRTSLGATAAQLGALMLHEGMLLSGLGGIFGLAGCMGGVALLHRVLPLSTPRLAELDVDWRAFVVSFVIVVAVGFALAAIPARLFRVRDLAGTIRFGRGVIRGGHRMRGLLISVEFALALLLATGAVLMGRTLLALDHVDRGIRTNGLLTAKIEPTLADDGAGRAYWHQVLDAVRAVPGVQSAATILHLPMSGRSWGASVIVEGREVDSKAAPVRTAWQSISAGFFATSGLPVIRGREFSATDGPDAPMAIVVNQAFARAVFPGADPIGKRIQAGNATTERWATIVGVVGDMRHDSLNVPATAEVYVTMDQRMVGATSLVVRAAGDPLSIAGGVREAVAAIDRNVPISDMRTMNDLYTAALARPRLLLALLSFFAGAGTVLSAVGIYGIVAYGVRQRRREIGIRAALGADDRRLQWTFVQEGARFALGGILLGVPVALIAARTMRSLLFGVGASDPLTLAGNSALLLVIAVLASWIPSRAATRVAPASALRSD